MKKYCYRIDVKTRLGKDFRSWWNRFVKAERAQQAFCRKVGADGWQDDEGRVLAGGVVAVSFAEGTRVDWRQWRASHKDMDGVQMYVPDVEHRTGCTLITRRGFMPSSTATRLYDRRAWPWQQVSSQHTTEEWARQAGIALTGDDAKDRELVSRELTGRPCCPYIDLYHKDYDPLAAAAEGKRRTVPYWVREAIRIEMARMQLPTVTPQSLYTLIDARVELPEGQQQAVVHDFAPQFFEYNGFYWLSVSRPAHHKSCTEVDEPTFNSRLRDMQALQRELERQEREERKGS